MTTYCGAAPSGLTDKQGQAWLISAVARALNPGCKADCALDLEGNQGTGKSSALKILAGNDWFYDGLHNLHSNAPAPICAARGRRKTLAAKSNPAVSAGEGGSFLSACKPAARLYVDRTGGAQAFAASGRSGDEAQTNMIALVLRVLVSGLLAFVWVDVVLLRVSPLE